MGAKPDLEIMGFIAREMGAAAALGPWTPEHVFEEIRRKVRGYQFRRPRSPAGGAAQTMPVNGPYSGGEPARTGAFRPQRLVRVGYPWALF